jgi:hypothetical protein
VIDRRSPTRTIGRVRTLRQQSSLPFCIGETNGSINVAAIGAKVNSNFRSSKRANGEDGW